MNGAQFVFGFLGLILEAIVSGFSYFILLLTAHGGSLWNFYWGAIVAFLVYRLYVKPAMNHNGTPDKSGPGSDWSL